MSWTCYKKSCLLGHFVYETVCLLSGQFVSTYNICFATRVAWWKENIFVTVLNVMNNKSTKICSYFFNAIANVTLSKFPQCPRESCESWSRCPCCWPPGMWPLAAGPRDPEPGDTPARPRPWSRHGSDDWQCFSAIAESASILHLVSLRMTLLFLSISQVRMHQFKNLCAHHQEEVLRISKHSQLVKFGWFLAMLWQFKENIIFLK